MYIYLTPILIFKSFSNSVLNPISNNCFSLPTVVTPILSKSQKFSKNLYN